MNKAQILVVEDESIVALDLQNRLKRLGYSVPVTVATGEEAVQKAAEIRPDLVLMDIRLRGDMDGIEAAQKIQTLFKIPVIYLTALADHETMQSANSASAYGYLLKPIDEQELYATIKKALSRDGGPETVTS